MKGKLKSVSFTVLLSLAAAIPTLIVLDASTLKKLEACQYFTFDKTSAPFTKMSTATAAGSGEL